MKTHYFIALAAGLSAGPAFAFDTYEDLAAGYVAAVAAEDLEAVKNLYTEEVDSFLPEGGLATSREVIAAEWKKLFDAFDNIEMYAHEAGYAEEGNLRAGWGDWGMKGTPAGGGDAVEWTGPYMDVAVKTDGGWKYRADLAPMNVVAPEGKADGPASE